MKNRFNSAFIILLILSGSLLSATDWAAVIDLVGPGVAKITLTDAKGSIISQGTGFMTVNSNDEEVLVTNAHVVRDARYNETVSITADFLYGNDSGKTYTGEIDQIDFYLDLCAIVLDDRVPAVLSINKGDDAPLMSEIAVVGYPLGKNFKATPGYVQAFQTIEKMGMMIDLSSSVAPGNSGGPVINGEGIVIGIATAVIPGYNFNLALPVSNLNSFLQGESNQVPLTINSNPDSARIFLDGDYKGISPFTLNLYNKEYQLRLEKDGYVIVEESIGPWLDNNPIDYSRSLNKKENLNPEITIITDPAGAEIFINNRLIGVSPAIVTMSEGRILRIRAKKRRYKDSTQSYTVSDDEEQTINITLKR